LFWSNGYEALRALDDNGDGELRGAELRKLAIWRDRNQNGVSEKGEVSPLTAHGIAALSCAYARRTVSSWQPTNLATSNAVRSRFCNSPGAAVGGSPWMYTSGLGVESIAEWP
jgi:hypothetical protein